MDIMEFLLSPTGWILLLIIFVAILYSMRQYIGALFSSLFFDYVIDAGLSWADLLVGISVAGVDIGDWLAAIILFLKYKSEVGLFWAVMFMLEAANFGLSFIPGVGEGFEAFFNLFPLVSIVVFFKQHAANKVYNEAHGYAQFLKQENREYYKKMQGQIDRMQDLYERAAYQDLKKEATGLLLGLRAEVEVVIQKKIVTLQKQLAQLPREQAAPFEAHASAAEQQIATDWRGANAYVNDLLQQVSSLVYQYQTQNPDSNDYYEQERGAA